MVVKNLKVTGKLTVGEDKLYVENNGNLHTTGWIASDNSLRIDGGAVGGKFYAKPDGSVWSLKAGSLDDCVKYDTQLSIINDSNNPLSSSSKYLGGGTIYVHAPMLSANKNPIITTWKIVK